MFIQVDLNIGSERYLPDGPFRRAEARRSVKMFHIPKGLESIVLDSSVPDFLVTEAMIDRYLELRPPRFRITTTFELIISEIERAFVLGQFFAAVAASVVSIERMLNEARIRLHEHAIPKLKDLWGKGPLNEWAGNIDALQQRGYLQPQLATELKTVFEIRCRYLHSAAIESPEEDARRSVRVAFDLLTEFIGFPDRLFKIHIWTPPGCRVSDLSRRPQRSGAVVYSASVSGASGSGHDGQSRHRGPIEWGRVIAVGVIGLARCTVVSVGHRDDLSLSTSRRKLQFRSP